MSTDSPDWVKANQGKAKAAFEQDKSTKILPDIPMQQSQEPRGSEMVKKHTPAPALTPSGLNKNAVHAQSYNQNLIKEKIGSNQRIKEALAKHKATQIRKDPQKQVELDKEKDKGGREQ